MLFKRAEDGSWIGYQENPQEDKAKGKPVAKTTNETKKEEAEAKK